MQKIIWFLKNDAVFWIFFTALVLFVLSYILKKEGIIITIDLGQNYGDRVITIGN